MNKEQLKIRAYGEAINERTKREAREMRLNQAFRDMLRDLNIYHIN